VQRIIELTVYLQVLEWHVHGLYTDTFSVQNGVLVTQARGAVLLLIDPQSVGKTWISRTENGRGLQVSRHLASLDFAHQQRRRRRYRRRVDCRMNETAR